MQSACLVPEACLSMSPLVNFLLNVGLNHYALLGDVYYANQSDLVAKIEWLMSAEL